MSSEIDIKGLRKEAVLAALYNLAAPKGKGFLQYNSAPITAIEAEMIIEEGDDLTQQFGSPDPAVYYHNPLFFDYVRGRLLKVDLSEDTLDARMYNKKNGKGSAELVINILRETGKVFSEEAKEIHAKNIVANATELMDVLNAPAIKNDPGSNVVYVGFGDAKDLLKEAVRKAIENLD